MNSLTAVSVTWLGQAGYLFSTARTSVLLDAFLAPLAERAYPPPGTADDYASVAITACTHEHLDHLDTKLWRALAAKSPAMTFVAPAPLETMVRELGVDASQLRLTVPGKPLALPGVTFHPIRAVHGVSMNDAYTSGDDAQGNPRFLGYVLDFEGVRIYHAGDTLVYPGLADAVKAHRPHAVLLPINGRDAYREARGIVGNMSYREAAQLAAEIGPTIAIPFHYDLFAGNAELPGRFVDELYGIAPVISAVVMGRSAKILIGA